MDPDIPKQSAPSMSEIFERLCPYYMSYGMTYDQYWHGDPWSLKDYKTAHGLRMREQNQMLWVQGLYSMNALSVVIGNAFSKKGTPPRKYLEKPLDIFPKTETEQKVEMEQKQQELIAKLSIWKKMFDEAKKE